MKEQHRDHPQLWERLQDLEAGTMTDAERDALMKQLAESPDARALYLEYFEMSAMLTDEARTQSEQDKLPPVPLHRRSRLYPLAAAACLLLALLWQFRPPATVPVTTASSPPPTMTATAVSGTAWRVEDEAGKTRTSPPSVTVACSVEVLTGTLRLEHPSGAQFMLQGPCRVHFASLNRPQIDSGWLWLDTKNGGEAFELETPDLLLKDIGTRFGIRVPENGPAEVHLFEGKIDAYAKRTKRKLLQLTPENQGVLLDPDREPAGVALAPDPFSTADRLMAVNGSYETVLLSQSPTDYWRFESSDTSELANRIEGGTVGKLHPRVQRGALGPSSHFGLPGMGDDNPGLQLEGVPAWAPVSLGTGPIHSDVILQEDFTYPGGLHQLRPGPEGSDVNWVASPAFGGDGRLEPRSTGTATLAFTPIDGRVYTLDASFEDIRSDPGIDSWIGLGFASGQSVSSYIYGMRENRFLEGRTTGRAWLLFRSSGSPLPHQACLGATGANGGIADAADWVGWEDEPGGDIDLRMILDTTGGPGHWSATWQAKRPREKAYRTVRPQERLLHEEIHSVGLAVGKEGLSGQVKSLHLRAEGMKDAPRDWLATAPAEIGRRSGSISLWIQARPAREDDQIIWSAGSSPRDDSMHLRLSLSGQLSFFIDHDRYDVLISSPTALTNETWHHVVACWSDKRAELYIDGRLVASDSEIMPMAPKVLRELHLGSGALGSRFSPLQATIDELAVWQRPLTAREIRHQYDAARGQLEAR